jgi:hypothetical protein
MGNMGENKEDREEGKEKKNELVSVQHKVGATLKK